MKNKNINEEAYFERIRELANVNKHVIKESIKSTTLLDYKKANDGRLYGIVKENQAYFIKTAHANKLVSESDFAYIGGLSNITEYKCKSLTDAQRVLNTKVMTINETYGIYEDDQDEEMPLPTPEPTPEPAPAPQTDGEQMPEPSPEPMPEPTPEPKKDEVHSAISSAAGLFSDADIEPSKVEYYLKQFLGVIKDSQLSKLRDEQKEAIFNEYFNSVQVEEGYSLKEVDEFMLTPENIAAIVAGVSAVFGGAFAIDKLKNYLKKNNPEAAKKIEDIASSAASGIKGGTTSFEESDDFLNEEDIYEDDMLDDDMDDVDVEIDSPDMEDMTVDVNQGMDGMSNDKEVHIDLNSGTINVKLSEAKIKELAGKYNVSESYIKWKMNDIMQEEIEKVEKEKLQEEKVRKVVRNIIKEKLGLKKKSINESVSKERLKLEKLVESVLKKKI